MSRGENVLDAGFRLFKLHRGSHGISQSNIYIYIIIYICVSWWPDCFGLFLSYAMEFLITIYIYIFHRGLLLADCQAIRQAVAE